jgi:hypothetical protein
MNKSKWCANLIEKNILTNNTRISAKVTVSGFGFIPATVEKTGTVSKISNNYLIVSFSNKDEKIPFNSITKIEGMEIERFVKAYGIK